MKRKIHLALSLLLATFACEGFAQELPPAARLDAERERIERERKPMFDAGNAATQAGKGLLPRSGGIEREEVTETTGRNLVETLGGWQPR